MHIIPAQPKTLDLTIDHHWHGALCPDDEIAALVSVSHNEEGVVIRAVSSLRDDMEVPDVPVGQRVDRLWETDVVECFLVGAGQTYLEVELGAAGHWLVLSFDGVRECVSSHEDLRLDVRYSAEDGRWESAVTIPWKIVPKQVRAINTFVIARGQFLAASPLPGEVEDFHQPDAYPEAKIDSDPRQADTSSL